MISRILSRLYFLAHTDLSLSLGFLGVRRSVFIYSPEACVGLVWGPAVFDFVAALHAGAEPRRLRLAGARSWVEHGGRSQVVNSFVRVVSV